MFLIRHLEAFRSLTIITNGLKTAQELTTLNHRVYCTGGLMLHNSSAYVGDYAADFVRHFNADIFFFSSRGVSEDGHITDESAEETGIRRVMLQQSRRKIFMCDRSKLGKTYCYNLCHTNQMDAFITDE
jgi:DeoR/GlpR family transcriptional regulator of sugar metabolism